jgi:hypothetical protein
MASWWFNFSDGRNLDKEQARVEANVEKLGGGSYSPPAPSGGSPRPSEIRAAKEAAVGGTADKCTKGKSCSATCIHINKECLVELSENAGAALSQLSKFLSGGVDKGELSEETAQEAIDRISDDKAALEKFGKLINSGKASESDLEGVSDFAVSVALAPGQNRNASRTMSYEELQSISDRGLNHFEKAADKSIGEDGVFNPRLPGGMNDLVKSRFLVREISDEAAEAAYAMLPSTAKSAMNKAGAPAKGTAFAGYDENGEPIFGEPSKVRGVFLVKRWMEQGGIDPYTGNRIDIRRAEPEHLFSFSEAKKTGVSGDQPENLLWADPKPNNLKVDLTFPRFKEVVDKALAMGKEKYTRDVYEPAEAKSAKTMGAKASAQSDLGKALSAMTPKERAESIKKLLDTDYGETGNSPLVRYLFRAAKLDWQFADRGEGRSVAGRPSWVNKRIPQLPSLKVKPSRAILVALAAVQEEKREELQAKLNSLVKERTLDKKLEPFLKANPEERDAMKAQKDIEYAEGVERVVKEYVPDIESYLANG